jgi:hypothetical protein
MILDEIQPGFGRTGKLLVFKIMMLSLTLLLWEGEWEAACLVLYSFICNDGLLEVINQLGHITPLLRSFRHWQHVWLP